MDAATWKSAQASTEPREWRNALRFSLVEHRHYLVYCGYYLLTAWLMLTLRVGNATELLARNISDLAYAVFLPVVVTLLLWLTVQCLRHRKFDLGHLAAEGRRTGLLEPTRVARVLPVLATLPFILGTFLSTKVQIGHLQNFEYDGPIIRMTTHLIGGKPAWTYFEGLFDHPWAIVALDDLYYLWFPVLCATFVWRMFSFRDPHLRLQFLLTIAVCWGVVGSFAAIAFPSAGPAFLPHLWDGPTPYDGLLEHLGNLQRAGYDLTSQRVQSMLWNLYASGSTIGGSGISAMPSLHVTMAAVLAIYGWRLGRVAGAAYTVFALLIFLGSIMLAFHYALDGMVGAAIAAVVWKGAGKLADLAHPRAVVMSGDAGPARNRFASSCTSI